MGWWSATIMGGDTPLDGEYIIFKFLGIKSDDNCEYDPVKAKELLTTRQEDVLAHINDEIEEYNRDIYKQVLGVLIMRYGSTFDEDTKTAVISAAQSDSDWKEDVDEDNEYDPERAKYISDFIDKINQYQTQPTEIQQEGLFQKIAEHMDSGKNGLVNKNIVLFFIVTTLFLFGGISTTSAQDTINIFTPHNEPIVYCTEAKDSLFIYDNGMGRLIRDIWVEDPISYDGYSPAVIMVPSIITLFKKIESNYVRRLESNLSN